MRTFVAIEISNPDVRNSIKQFQSEFIIKAKPVKIENIHFTLLFLGEVLESMVPKIKEAISKIEFSSFDVIFRGVGVFPKPSFPRVIWLGTDNDGGEKLKGLAKKVEESLSPLGFHSDKPFHPHVTIFRIKNKVGNISEELMKYQGNDFGLQRVSEIKLKKSELTQNGPIYSDLHVVKGI